MKILSAAQIRQADAYTITHEPIASIDLMERAAHAFTEWFLRHVAPSHWVRIVCGLGNNGGDGLAIARLLHERHYEVEVYVVWYAEHTSDDFSENLSRLPGSVPLYAVRQAADIPSIRPADVWIDALFGSGLNRPLSGLAAAVVDALNQAVPTVIAVDIPSGLLADIHTESHCVVQATHTVSFQVPKLAFLFRQNAPYVGNWHLLDIGLHPEALVQADTSFFYVDRKMVKPWLLPRDTFSHKGTFGHALLIAGNEGMTGAAILAARACLRAGVGKLSVCSAMPNYTALQTAVPEALFVTHPTSSFTSYTAIGAGPGMGSQVAEVLQKLTPVFEAGVPLVLDADALNALADQQGRAWLQKLPPHTILTPHPKEFQKLLGTQWTTDFDRLDHLRAFARTHQVIVCLKGAYTATALPDGRVFFNATGNPGLATGGTGDVLTGILTALLAQGYNPEQAAILGVYLHGLAGDEAAQHKGYYSLIASDVAEYLPQAFMQLGGLKKDYL